MFSLEGLLTEAPFIQTVFKLKELDLYYVDRMKNYESEKARGSFIEIIKKTSE